MKAFLRTCDALAIAGRYLAGTLLVCLAALVIYEIGLRFFTSRSTNVVDEYAGYAMAAVVFLGAADALRKGEHIRIVLAQEVLGERAQVWLERIVACAGVIFATLLFYAFLGLTSDAFEFGTRSLSPSRTPLAFPQGVVLLGIGILWLQFVAFLVRAWSAQLKKEEGRGIRLG